MAVQLPLGKFFKDAWEVLVLFIIPIGGGIPGGVLLAKSRGIGWALTTFLYFVSDVMLACAFDPLMKLFIIAGRHVTLVNRIGAAFRRMVHKSMLHYGNTKNPFALVLISFGVDPMTGRAAALAAGHGFVTGWMIAIAGDMIYFALLMGCTLWLKSLIGDGTAVMLIILVVMIALPPLFRRLRGKPRVVTSSGPDDRAGPS